MRWLQTIKAEMVMDEGVRCMEGEEMDCVTPHGKTSNRVVPECSLSLGFKQYAW